MPAFAITEKNFKKEIKRCKTPVLLSFWADCGVSSVLMRETADFLSERLCGKVKVCAVKVCADELKNTHKLAEKYGVKRFPATLLIENGEVSDRIAGNPGKEGFLRILGVTDN